MFFSLLSFDHLLDQGDQATKNQMFTWDDKVKSYVNWENVIDDKGKSREK